MTDLERLERAVRRLCDADIECLREINEPGSQEGFVWSAAETLSVETLRNLGMITGSTEYEITPLGHKLLTCWKIIELADVHFPGRGKDWLLECNTVILGEFDILPIHLVDNGYEQDVFDELERIRRGI